jgi:hypothetical protein
MVWKERKCLQFFRLFTVGIIIRFCRLCLTVLGKQFQKKKMENAHPHLTVYFTGVTFPFHIVTFEKNKTLHFF